MHDTAIDVAIIGAGPYGLSLAYQLQCRGVARRVFGRPMQFWHDMPPGMFLKSYGFATSIPTPDGDHTLPAYCRARGLEHVEPIAISTFAAYGLAFQERFVPDVEPTHAVNITAGARGFEIHLESGEDLVARRVVVATGLSCFEVIAPQLAKLPRALVSHTGEHQDFARFKGQDVTIIGGGQSALQAAALLHEAGASVRVLSRERVIWNTQVPLDRPLMDRLRTPNSVLGASRVNWVLQHVPSLIHHAPTERRVRFTRGHLGPAGAWWLRDRVDGIVPVQERVVVKSACEAHGKVRLDIAAGDSSASSIETDHVVAGTGYEVDVDRLSFIDAEIRRGIERIVRAPRLNRRFESSVSNLYFIGPAAAFSFGPLARFVAGAPYATGVVARHLARCVHGRKVVFPFGRAAAATPEPSRVRG